MPDFLRIVTLSDMFDAMTTDRVYRRRIPVHLALENLMADCISKLDAKIYNRFVIKAFKDNKICFKKVMIKIKTLENVF